jgi:hypothetical protein
VGQTQVFQESVNGGPPAMLDPRSFKSLAARTAAQSVAIPWQGARYGQPHHFGKELPENCTTTVDHPLYAADYAFVRYSDPNGGIGAIAFRRHDGIWEINEDVRLGYW